MNNKHYKPVLEDKTCSLSHPAAICDTSLFEYCSGYCNFQHSRT